MTQPKVALSLENKLRKQASMVADVARLQYKDAWAHDSSARSITLNGIQMQTQQQYTFKQTKPTLRDTVQNAESVLASESLTKDVSLVNAFSDADDSATKLYLTESIPHAAKQPKITSTPLNVTELSPNRSHLMSPPSIRSFSAAAICNREVRMLESGSSPLDEHSPRDYAKPKKRNQLVVPFKQLERPMSAAERTKPSNVSISALSAEDPSTEKPMPQTFHERYLDLAAMIGDPAVLDDQWKLLDQAEENAVELAHVRAWCSTQFSGMINDIAINKAFHFTASSIEGEIKHLVPRRAFKRLLLAILYISRSLDCFASIDSSSNGNPRITFELFCTAVSKLGSKMDRKRCLFEYQGIHSRTKDYLQIDEFHSWLINSKIFKVQKNGERSVAKHSKSSSSHRFSKSNVIENRRAQLLAAQKHNQQFVTMVESDLQLGDHSSTKKFSIGIVPFKQKIDRLTHDKGPDFFRSTLKANLEAQRKLKDERLDNLAKVAHEQRLRSLPADSNIPSFISTKDDYATSRASSNIARPKFTKMYEYIDSYLDEKLSRMASEALLSRLDHEARRSRDDGGGDFDAFFNEPPRAEAKPTATAASISPAPQPSPLMHTHPPEYPSPNPQLSDISNFETSPNYNSPSRFANIALGWQDTMGLPINLYAEDSPITKALKNITNHLNPSSSSIKLTSLAETFTPSYASEQQLLPQQSAVESNDVEDVTSCPDEYSQMIAETLRALSPATVNPRRSANPSESPNTPRNPTSGAKSELFASRRHRAEETSSITERVPISTQESNNIQDFSFTSTLSVRAVLPDPSDVLTTDPEVLMQPIMRFNLFQDVQQEQADAAFLKESSQKFFTRTRALPHQHDESANSNDTSPVAAETQLPSQALFLQSPELTTSQYYHDHFGKDIVRSSPPKSSQIVEATMRATVPSQNDTSLSPIGYPRGVATGNPRISPQSAEKGHDANDSREIMKERISRQKREARMLEEGIKSIRGISELLEMFTDIPATNAESHAKGLVARMADVSDANSNLSRGLEFNHEAINDEWPRAGDSAHERAQQSGPSKSRTETIAQLLPEIVVSPETQRLKVNLVASVLRDALPIHGLDLTPNESDIDEGAISGDDSES